MRTPKVRREALPSATHAGGDILRERRDRLAQQLRHRRCSGIAMPIREGNECPLHIGCGESHVHEAAPRLLQRVGAHGRSLFAPLPPLLLTTADPRRDMLSAEDLLGRVQVMRSAASTKVRRLIAATASAGLDVVELDARAALAAAPLGVDIRAPLAVAREDLASGGGRALRRRLASPSLIFRRSVQNSHIELHADFLSSARSSTSMRWTIRRATSRRPSKQSAAIRETSSSSERGLLHAPFYTLDFRRAHSRQAARSPLGSRQNPPRSPNVYLDGAPSEERVVATEPSDPDATCSPNVATKK
jgi:hypothetical protein